MDAFRAWVTRDMLYVTDENQALIASQQITSRRIGMLGWVDTLAEMGYIQTSPWRGTNEKYHDRDAQHCGAERAG